MIRVPTIDAKRYGYSPMESSILSALNAKKGRKVTTNELVEVLYEGRQPPISARQSVLSTIKVLIQKVEHNQEPFKIGRTKGMGPSPHVFWREKR